MGAVDFEQYQPGESAKEAFEAATEEARYLHGHGGYSGTLAEKHSFVIVEKDPLPLREAQKRAYDLIEDEDERIRDKWGPAGAIPVEEEDGEKGWLFFGWASW